MILLKFASEISIKQVIDIFEFSRNLIINQNSTSEEFNMIIKSIREIVPWKNLFPVLLVRPDEVDVMLGNAIWILEQTIEKEKIDEEMKVMYTNSIGLMKEVKAIVLDKVNSDKPKIIKGRKFFPELEKFYKSNFNKFFIFSSDYGEIENLITPKSDEIWKLISYIEADLNKNLDDPEEDSLIIINENGVKFMLPVSEFNQLAFLKT